MKLLLHCLRGVPWLAVLLGSGCSSRVAAIDPQSQATPPSSPEHLFELEVLVFTRTLQFRHESIAAATEYFRTLDPKQGIRTTVTEEPSVFSRERLADYDVVAFVNTTGDVLNDAQQQALQDFIHDGRGFVGVHAAADTEHDWPWYKQLVGAEFVSHPQVPLQAALRVENVEHLSVAHLGSVTSFTDEWYNFDHNPRGEVNVLLTVDEADFTVPNTPPGPSMGEDHPVAWFQAFEGGRSFYTNLGHRIETWRDSRFQTHLLEGIRWAAGGGRYTRAVMTHQLSNPLALAIAANSDVYIAERTGQVLRYVAETGQLKVALTLEVDTGYENGLLGIVLDPAFASNRYVYLYYSQPRGESDTLLDKPGSNVVARFTAQADGSLAADTRRVLLAVPSERRCCHEGGSLAFSADGDLLLSTGDNTNPFESEGTAPLDTRAGRETYNSQRTAANPYDLRGKILRIRTDGGIPEGNLFPADGSAGRPEVYVMGVRNPFRIAADPARTRVFFGDVGPDAQFDSLRGPRGYDEINLADAPGDYGWPYCIGFNRPYAAVDFSTGVVGAAYDCSEKVAPLLAYDYFSIDYEALGSGVADDGAFLGRTAVAAAVYRKRARAYSLPARFEGQLLMTEWTRDILAAVAVDEASGLRAVKRLFRQTRFHRPIDVEVAPDGAVYVLEYGSDFWGNNPDAGLSRIEYGQRTDLSPQAHVVASPIFGSVPLTVQFSGLDSATLDGVWPTRYAWDFDGDGEEDAAGPQVRHTFDRVGEYQVTLTVTSRSGRRSLPASARIVVGNAPPSVRIVRPERGQVLTLGQVVSLSGQGTDPEDGQARCDELTWNIGLIHNTHAHPFLTLNGCETTFVPTAQDHDPSLGAVSYSIELAYTDHGGAQGEAPQTARQGLQFEARAP